MKSPRSTVRSEGRKQDAVLRQHVVSLLHGGNAHVAFDKAVTGVPASIRGTRHPNVPFTLWGLLEHMRIAQWDILEFSRDAKHVSPQWPDEYWPKAKTPPNAKAWSQSVRAFLADLEAMR